MSKVEKNEEAKKGEGQTKTPKKEPQPMTLEYKDVHCKGCLDELGKKVRKGEIGGFEIVEAAVFDAKKNTLTMVGKGVLGVVSEGIKNFEGKHNKFKDKISIVKAAGSSDKKKTENGSEEKKKPAAEAKGATNGEEKTKKVAVAAAEGKKDGGEKKPASQPQLKLREPYNRREYGVPIPPGMITVAALDSSTMITTRALAMTYHGGQSFLKQILPMLPDACSLM